VPTPPTAPPQPALPVATGRADRRTDGLLQLALAAAVVLLATSLVRFTVTRFGYEPTLNRLHDAQLAQADADRAMLDMETGVRGYQLSADPRFLGPYTSGLAAYPAAVTVAGGRLAEVPDALSRWSSADAAARAWQRNYAAAAVAAVHTGSGRPDLADLIAGKAQFDHYRQGAAAAAATLAATVARGRSAETLFRTATGAVQALALLLLAFALFRRQRRPHAARHGNDGFPLSAAAADQWQDGLGAEAVSADPGALAASITRAAQAISGAVAAHLWLADDDGELRRVDAGQPVVAAQRRRHDVALRAHREGAIITTATRSRRITAVPLLHQGRTLGVVELTLPGGSGEPTNAQTEMLRAWGRQAAQAVLLGPVAAGRDRLTGFGGRLALDSDLRNAVEQARSTDRPVSLVVLEVDHLSRHSTEGTALRDELVRTVGAVLSDTVRTSDTAYRTGEGAFAVLLPATPAQAAASLAERLRQIIARRFIERGVTASFGVATCPDAAADELGLAEAAGSALYDAQRFGGNRAQPAQPLSDELALVRRRATEIE
jgi:diguanylate cyclase (GGDEF)-like protein